MRSSRSAIEIKGVVHRPRGMVRGDIERLEVVVGVLDLRAFHHGESGVGEEPLDASQRAGDGMQTARPLTAPRQGDVDAFAGQPARERRLLQRRSCGHQCACLDRDLGLIDRLPGGRALFARQGAELLEQGGQFTALAQITHPNLIERRQIGGVGDRVDRALLERRRSRVRFVRPCCTFSG